MYDGDQCAHQYKSLLAAKPEICPADEAATTDNDHDDDDDDNCNCCDNYVDDETTLIINYQIDYGDEYTTLQKHSLCLS